jgi:hypothetical protein
MKTTVALGGLFSRKSNISQICHLPVWLGVLLAASISSSAAPLTGGFGIVGNVTVDLTTIDWESNGGGDGLFITTGPDLGDFNGIASAFPIIHTGTVKDLFAPPAPVTRFLDGFSAPGFGGLFFDLSAVIAPIAPACTGLNLVVDVPCSLGAFTIKNAVLGGVVIDFGVSGFFQNGADPSTRTAGKGLYSTQLLNESVATIYFKINNGQSISTAYAASFVATPGAEIPEPATYLLIGSGIAGLGLFRRRSN